MLNTPKPSAKPFAFTAVSSLFILIILLFMVSSCKKQAVDQLSILPPATQTGANTFGCLVNGTAFTPRRRTSVIDRSVLSCNYGFYSRGYAFSVRGIHEYNDGSDVSVTISTDSLRISADETIPLTKFSTPGYASGLYLDNQPVHITDDARGQLMITRLDTINQIVSGTFYFKAVRANGDTVRITNGRFDMRYKL